MKLLFLIFFSALISISAISQDINYRKDDRPQNVKEDPFNEYQVNHINLVSEIDMLKALELLGVRIFGIPISPAFEKEYSISLKLDEYVEGKKTNSQDINITPNGKNTYVYAEPPITEESTPFFDYIPKFTIFVHDKDTIQTLRINSYNGSVSGIILKKDIIRNSQFYMWRGYSKTDWKLNEEIPLLVYGSSWNDGHFERFCGVADLSLSEERTKELFDNSPHYYIISLYVSE